MLNFSTQRVSSLQEYPIGKKVCDQTAEGPKEYIYCLADASGVTGDGFVCLIDPATFTATMITTTNAAPGTGTGKLVGVARRAVPASNYCWLQIYGAGNVQVLASAVLFTRLNTTATAGALDDDGTAGARVINGMALTATRAASQGNAAGLVNYSDVGVTI